MKKQTKENKLDIIRHSTAHILAAAVLERFPKAKLAIGPTIENGFYYDFDDTKITETDLSGIEKKMREIIKNNPEFKKQKVSPAEAKKLFKDQPYKLELIKELQKNKKPITIYINIGTSDVPNINVNVRTSDVQKLKAVFIDLCAGPHVKSAKEINPDAFKLTKLAGAYWRGDEKNKMLTRIYGVAFDTKKELDDYLNLLEEAKKRDHRLIGEKLELFMFSEDVGPGLPFWLPKGMVIREELEKLAKEIEGKAGYIRVWTPHITRAKLYEISGHLPYYQDEMYPPMKAADGDYYLKPMNCPHHYIIYKQKIHSYKELPIRIAEYGTVYRYEKAGELLGLFRPRGFTQNDAHIICSKEQIKEEFLKVIEMHVYYYKLFGIKDFYMRLSLRDPKKKKKFINNEKMWQYSEKAIKEAMKESGLLFKIGTGEAAFYGPKIDFQIKSVIGKEYSASTNQLDFAAGPRFDLNFINKYGEKETAFVIHRSPLGSHERFIGFLIEHFAGALPLWLSPVQAVILPIGEKQITYAQKIYEALKHENIRVEIPEANETLGKRIREAEIQKIPYILVVGDKEMGNGTINVRHYRRGQGGEIKLEKLIEKLKEEIENKVI